MDIPASAERPVDRLMEDFFDGDDIARLAADAGRALGCPLMVVDDTFHIAAHYAPSDFADPVFDGAVQRGEITYEAGALLEKNASLASGGLGYITLEDSPHRRRFSPLRSGRLKLGYLVCVDVGKRLGDIPENVWRTVGEVLSKQLFIEVSRQDKYLGTAEEILIHLLDGGFDSEAHFRLQASDTYLADFHPEAIALIDLSAYRSMYLGKNQLKDELTYRFYASHPFLYKGDVLLFLDKSHDLSAFDDLAREFHLKIVISEPLDGLYRLPEVYRRTSDGLSLVSDGEGSGVYRSGQLGFALMLLGLRRENAAIERHVRALADSDLSLGTSYCETLYHYLTCRGSLKETCDRLFTHRNTVLYRIRRMKEAFDLPLDDYDAHAGLLMSAALVLFSQKGPGYFIK